MESSLSSLSAVQFRNEVSSQVGFSLPATLLLDYPSLTSIGSYLQDLFEEEAAKNDEIITEISPDVVEQGMPTPDAGEDLNIQMASTTFTPELATSLSVYPDVRGWVLFRGNDPGGDALLVPAPSRACLGSALFASTTLGGADGMQDVWPIDFPGDGVFSVSRQSQYLHLEDVSRKLKKTHAVSSPLLWLVPHPCRPPFC
eukprot:TRINITY_DN78081_c0_g1_i1.p1 TRINITY_DN78081_c0_g1~~TRINITY_DN78081_c0_g1_i1.p1  ORF type:complete len:200 (-),score=30.06 TRINITY_DN78081_c0_g1_i1:132-731(-)